MPKAVREGLSVQALDRVRYVIHADEVRIPRVQPIDRLFGALRDDGPPVTSEDIERAIADGVCKT